MKNSFLFAVCALVLGAAACKNDEPAVKEIRAADGPNAALIRNPISADSPLDTNQLARITFDEPMFDFGEIKEGDEVNHVYKFTNTGKAPLIIQNARASCGCTTPEWSNEPIPPGGTGQVLAKFNSDGRTGQQSKLIFVTANTSPNETKLKLSGFVQAKK
jgi:Protein of unknown function (DUF1573)